MMDLLKLLGFEWNLFDFHQLKTFLRFGFKGRSLLFFPLINGGDTDRWSHWWWRRLRVGKKKGSSKKISEIIKAIKGANSNKAPRPNCLDAHFFEVCWPIIGRDVHAAISDFFKSGKLLKRTKNTFIVLIPKTNLPTKPSDYRFIFFTNELYKIIARIIAARLKPVMEKIINPCQTAFIPGRSITENIRLSHDLLRSFHLNRGKSRMCLKIDLCNAFDSVS